MTNEKAKSTFTRRLLYPNRPPTWALVCILRVNNLYLYTFLKINHIGSVIVINKSVAGVGVPSLSHIILILSHPVCGRCGCPFTLTHYPDSEPSSLWPVWVSLHSHTLSWFWAIQSVAGVGVPSLSHIILILSHPVCGWCGCPFTLTHYPDSEPSSLWPEWVSLHSHTLSWFWAIQSVAVVGVPSLSHIILILSHPVCGRCGCPFTLTHYPDSEPSSLWPVWVSLHSHTLSWFWAIQSVAGVGVPSLSHIILILSHPVCGRCGYPFTLTHYPDSEPSSLWPVWVSLHSHTLSWFWAIQSVAGVGVPSLSHMILILSHPVFDPTPVYLAEKQHI